MAVYIHNRETDENKQFMPNGGTFYYQEGKTKLGPLASIVANINGNKKIVYMYSIVHLTITRTAENDFQCTLTGKNDCPFGIYGQMWMQNIAGISGGLYNFDTVEQGLIDFGKGSEWFVKISGTLYRFVCFRLNAYTSSIHNTSIEGRFNGIGGDTVVNDDCRYMGIGETHEHDIYFYYNSTTTSVNGISEAYSSSYDTRFTINYNVNDYCEIDSERVYSSDGSYATKVYENRRGYGLQINKGSKITLANSQGKTFYIKFLLWYWKDDTIDKKFYSSVYTVEPNQTEITTDDLTCNYYVRDGYRTATIGFSVSTDNLTWKDYSLTDVKIRAWFSTDDERSAKNYDYSAYISLNPFNINPSYGYISSTQKSVDYSITTSGLGVSIIGTDSDTNAPIYLASGGITAATLTFNNAPGKTVYAKFAIWYGSSIDSKTLLAGSTSMTINSSSTTATLDSGFGSGTTSSSVPVIWYGFQLSTDNSTWTDYPVGSINYGEGSISNTFTGTKSNIEI